VPGIILNGNTCITAAITEMLLQSHTGIIDLLPALPKTFRQGEVKGLVARGGFVINVSWENNTLATGAIYSKYGNTCKIKLNKNYAVYQNDKPVYLKNEGSDIYSFETEAKETYIIRKADQ